MLHVETLEPRRLLTGELDPTFGERGFASVDFTSVFEPSSGSIADDWTIDRDGFIYLAVVAPRGGSIVEDPRPLLLARLTPAGALDGRFGDAGIQTLPRAANDTDISIDVDAQRRVYVRDGLQISRLTSRGKWDRTFGRSGRRTIAGIEDADELAVDRDGNAYVVGSISNRQDRQTIVVRLAPNGNLDTTWADFGKFTLPQRLDLGDAQTFAQQRDVRVLDSGQLMVAGTRNTEDSHNLYVARLDSNGARDRTYGDNGVASFTRDDTESQEFYTRLYRILDDGRVILGEEIGTPGDPDRSDVNYEISADGRTIQIRDLLPPQISIDPLRQSASEFALQSDGRFVVADAQRSWRVNRDGTLDLSWGDNGISEAGGAGGSGFPRLLVDNDGTILVGRLTGRGMTIARHLPDNGPVGRAIANDRARAGAGAHRFTIAWRDPQGVSLPLLTDRGVYVQRPDGTRTTAQVTSTRRVGDQVCVDYKISAIDGIWDQTENGTYFIVARRVAVIDQQGNFNASRTVGAFGVEVI